MRVQDSLQAGRSRFYAELLRVRQIVGLAREPRPLLFLLDELFGGTNSADRQAGAEAVARALVGAGAVGLLTTHDLALTGVADLLGARARNVHFADHLDGTAVRFDYTMRPGVVPHGNALAILRAAGLAV
jgi:DNA mismatch repair ATPase MutS